jgi:hypothetical protein
MQRRLPFAAACLAAVAVAAPVRAAPLTVLYDSRVVLLTQEICNPEGECSFWTPFESISTGEPRFVASLPGGIAFQDSTIGPLGFAGTGSAGVRFTPDPSGASTADSGSSAFSVTFLLAERSEWRLSGTIVPDGASRTILELCAPFCSASTRLLIDVVDGPDGTTPFDYVLTLDAGTYTLALGGSAAAPGPGSTEWSLSFTAVPEPAAASLVLLGLATLGARRRAPAEPRARPGAAT